MPAEHNWKELAKVPLYNDELKVHVFPPQWEIQYMVLAPAA